MNDYSVPAALLTPLTRDNAFLRREASPAYWALAPHLISQYTDCACALASATMVLNALRSLGGHHRIGDVVSEQRLLDAMNDDHWRAAFRPTDGDGLKLARYAADLPRALDLFQLTGWSVSMHRMPAGDAAASSLRESLSALQHRADRLIIANFHLATFYGDGVDIGHYSPLAAFDAERDRVLVLDVYKPDYEPSWAPLERMMAAMSVHDDRDVPRGYILLTRTDGNAILP